MASMNKKNDPFRKPFPGTMGDIGDKINPKGTVAPASGAKNWASTVKKTGKK